MWNGAPGLAERDDEPPPCADVAVAFRRFAGQLRRHLINQAKVDVANQDKIGAVGQAEAFREKEIKVAENVYTYEDFHAGAEKFTTTDLIVVGPDGVLIADAQGSVAQTKGLVDAIAKITTGSLHTCAIATSGRLWCWGASSSGQLGLGDRVHRDPAHRRAEPLREAHLHGVGGGRVIGEAHTGGDVRIPQACAIQMHAQPAFAREHGHLAQSLERHDRAAGAVMRVLGAHQRDARDVIVGPGCYIGPFASLRGDFGHACHRLRNRFEAGHFGGGGGERGAAILEPGGDGGLLLADAAHLLLDRGVVHRRRFRR